MSIENPATRPRCRSLMGVQILSHRHEVHIETAGTIAPNSFMQNWITQWVVSPKLNNSGNAQKKRSGMTSSSTFPSKQQR